MSKVKEMVQDWEVELHNTRIIFRNLTYTELAEKFDGLTEIDGLKIVRYTSPNRETAPQKPSIAPLRPLKR